MSRRRAPGPTVLLSVWALGLPLAFERNQGQTDPCVDHLARLPGGTLFLSPQEAVLRLESGRALRLAVLGSTASAPGEGLDPLEARASSFVGNDPSRWRAGIPLHRRVVYRGVRPGIDLVWHGSRDGRLEYDLVLAPGVAVEGPLLGFAGADRSRLDEATGDLVFALGGSDVRVRRPVAWEEGPGVRRRALAARYRLEDGRADRVSIEVEGRDPSRTLVLDPVLELSTYLGGSGEEGWDATLTALQGEAAVAPGAAVAVCMATGSADFPTASPLQPAPAGGARDVAIARLSPDGQTLEFSTYVGGTGDDGCHGVALDAAGAVYATGTTGSPDFPLASPLQPIPGGGAEAFVLKLDPTGTSLVYSTYLGGLGDDAGFAVEAGTGGAAHVTGTTTSSDFPTVAPLQPVPGGGPDAFVLELAPDGSSLVWSTYLGGSGSESAPDLALAPDGTAVVSGTTDSLDFPVRFPLQPANAGLADAFLARIAPGGSALAFSTYLGGSDAEEANQVTLHPSGDALLAGLTRSPDFPLFNPVKPVYGGAGDAFVARVAAEDGALLFSTYLGGTGLDHGEAAVVDRFGDFTLVGSTDSPDFPVANPIEPAFLGVRDAFAARVEGSGSGVVRSTWLGGSAEDAVLGGGADLKAAVHVFGFTRSTDLPLVNAVQPASAGLSDSFLMRIAPTFDFTLRSAVRGAAPGDPVSETMLVRNTLPQAMDLVTVTQVYDPCIDVSAFDPVADPTQVLVSHAATVAWDPSQRMLGVRLDRPLAVGDTASIRVTGLRRGLDPDCCSAAQLTHQTDPGGLVGFTCRDVCAALPAPALLRAVKAGPLREDVALSWRPLEEARGGYEAWRVGLKELVPAARASGSPPAVAACLPAAATWCTDPGIVPAAEGSPWFYQVQASCGGGAGP